MTTEQKAKAYDELLIKAKQIYNKENDVLIMHTIEDLFPELAESEDEKIRKTLIDFFQDWHKNRSHCWGISVPEILAWLEKQGEHKKFRDSIQVGDEVTRNSDGVIVNLSQLKRVAKKDEKQGEQKSQRMISAEAKEAMYGKTADKVEPKFKVKYAGSEYNVLDVKDIAGVTYYVIEDEPNHIDYVKANSCEIISGYAIKENGSPYPTKPAVFSEQKPTDGDMVEALRTEYEKGRADAFAQMQKEWSEEDDEKIRQTIINEFKQCSEWYCSNGLTKEDCINWLNRQKYFEWSDEDNENMNSLCVLLDDQMVSINAIGNEHSIEYKNWLKSLKQRCTWKPSDEQMEALNDVISSRDIKYDVLSELWKDLNTLKG